MVLSLFCLSKELLLCRHSIVCTIEAEKQSLCRKTFLWKLQLLTYLEKKKRKINISHTNYRAKAKPNYRWAIPQLFTNSPPFSFFKTISYLIYSNILNEKFQKARQIMEWICRKTLCKPLCDHFIMTSLTIWKSCQLSKIQLK